MPNLGELVEEERARRASTKFPTVTVHGNGNRKGYGGKSGDGLYTAVKLAAESAPWPTPTAKGNGNRSEYGGKSGDGIDTAVKRAEGILKPTREESATGPTPCAGRHGLDGGSHSRKAAKARGLYIANSVSAWPTPTANDYKGSGKNGELRDRLDFKGGICYGRFGLIVARRSPAGTFRFRKPFYRLFFRLPKEE